MRPDIRLKVAGFGTAGLRSTDISIGRLSGNLVRESYLPDG
jgi:hypothetical protein